MPWQTKCGDFHSRDPLRKLNLQTRHIWFGKPSNAASKYANYAFLWTCKNFRQADNFIEMIYNFSVIKYRSPQLQNPFTHILIWHQHMQRSLGQALLENKKWIAYAFTRHPIWHLLFHASSTLILACTVRLFLKQVLSLRDFILRPISVYDQFNNKKEPSSFCLTNYRCCFS